MTSSTLLPARLPTSCRPRARYLDWHREETSLAVTAGNGRRLLIPDPTGIFEQLLHCADGQHSLAALLVRLRETHPTLSADQLARALSALDRCGLIEDAGDVDEVEADRYERNLAFFGSYAGLATSRAGFQARLARARVLVLGLGGIGSTLMLNLAGLGVGHITAVDHDRVALSNLNRQFLYVEADVGASKVERACARVRALNGQTEVTGIERHGDSVDAFATLIAGHDLVLAAIDDPPDVLFQVNRACVAMQVPLIAGGLQATRGIYLGVDPGRSGCLDCDFARSGLDTPDPDPRGGNRSIGPAVTIAGGLMALEALRHLTAFAEPVSPGRLHSVDLATGLVEEAARWARFEGCPTCGTGR